MRTYKHLFEVADSANYQEWKQAIKSLTDKVTIRHWDTEYTNIFFRLDSAKDNRIYCLIIDTNEDFAELYLANSFYKVNGNFLGIINLDNFEADIKKFIEL